MAAGNLVWVGPSCGILPWFGRNLVGGLIVTMLASCLIVDLLAWSKMGPGCGKGSSESRLNNSSAESVSHHEGLARELERQAFRAQKAAVMRKLETIPSCATRSRERELCHQEMLLYLEPDTEEYAEHLTLYGDTLVNVGKLRDADNLYRRALTILGRSAGPRSPKYGATLLRLANLCHSMQRYDEETSLRRKAVDGEV